MNNKGQISLPIIMTGTSMLTGVFIWTYTQFNVVLSHQSDTDQRVAKVEEAITTLKENTLETRQDVKDILKFIKNGK